MAIAVEVAYGHGPRAIPHRVRLLGVKDALVLAEQHRDVVGASGVRAEIGGDQLRPAIVVQVGRHHGSRADTDGKTFLSSEGAIAVTTQH